jgi:N-acetyl-anhydromuramyl-L-alanine amidase AmpD
MNIIKDHRIFEKYFEPISEVFERENIREIVIHGTGGGASAQGIIKWMLNGGVMADGSKREDLYKRGIALFHYLIDRNGDLYHLIPDRYWCYHSSSGRHDIKTIGVELVNTVSGNKGKYEVEQYDSLFSLIKKMMTLYPIKYIAGHGGNKLNYSGSYKECPGEKFNWKMLEENFSLRKAAREIYILENENDKKTD